MTKFKYVPILMAGLALASCTRTVRTTSLSANRHPDRITRTQPAQSVMKRQIANAVDAGEGDPIARALRQRMSADPANLKVRMELARHYETSGYPEIASEHYRLAAQMFPDAADAVVGQARMLRLLDLPKQAMGVLAQFQTAHRETPAEVLCWLGILHDEAGNLPQAEASYRAALELKPESDSLHNNLGYNFLLQSRRAEAAVEFRKALAISPQSQIARNNLGAAMAAQPKEAVLQMESVSDPATAHSNLAAILIEQGSYGQAREELRIALGYRKDHLAALSNLQLVSELDGQPFALPDRVSETRWKRFSGGVKRVLLGTGERVHSDQNVKTASK